MFKFCHATPVLPAFFRARATGSRVRYPRSRTQRQRKRRRDRQIGTLRRLIEAMGGSLQLRAVFPDNMDIRIEQQIPQMNSTDRIKT